MSNKGRREYVAALKKVNIDGALDVKQQGRWIRKGLFKLKKLSAGKRVSRSGAVSKLVSMLVLEADGSEEDESEQEKQERKEEGGAKGTDASGGKELDQDVQYVPESLQEVQYVPDSLPPAAEIEPGSCPTAAEAAAASWEPTLPCGSGCGNDNSSSGSAAAALQEIESASSAAALKRMAKVEQELAFLRGGLVDAIFSSDEEGQLPARYEHRQPDSLERDFEQLLFPDDEETEEKADKSNNCKPAEQMSKAAKERSTASFSKSVEEQEDESKKRKSEEQSSSAAEKKSRANLPEDIEGKVRRVCRAAQLLNQNVPSSSARDQAVDNKAKVQVPTISAEVTAPQDVSNPENTQPTGPAGRPERMAKAMASVTDGAEAWEADGWTKRTRTQALGLACSCTALID